MGDRWKWGDAEPLLATDRTARDKALKRAHEDATGEYTFRVKGVKCTLCSGGEGGHDASCPSRN